MTVSFLTKAEKYLYRLVEAELSTKQLNMNNHQLSERTISDIVRSDYRTADVFKKYAINYCCSGQISLQEACDLRNLDKQVILEKLDEATRNISISNSLQFNEWKIDFLIDYIINVHHAYLNDALPAQEARLESFIKGHKNKFPELIKINEVFLKLSSLLKTHIKQEEDVVFPYIKQIDSAYKRKESYGNLFVRTLRKPSTDIEKEHAIISELLKTLKQHSNGYRFPENACTNHQVLYHKLREFHDDLVQHKHLENNVLFPKAKEIEEQLLQA